MEQLPAIFYNLSMRLFDAVGPARKSGTHVCTALISSARRGEGKTFIAKRLASHLASVSNEQILLVDANFQHPGVCGEPGAAGDGFSDCLTSGNYDRAAFTATPFPNLMLLPAGSNPRTGLLFKPSAMHDFLSAMAGRFTMVLIDGGTAEECGCLPQVASGVILVVDAQKTRREVVQGAMAGMNIDRGKYYGVILNKKARYIPQSLYRRF